jgi:hypothetical protein
MMNKFGLVMVACAFGVAACSQLREPTDTQLATLLHSERSNPADPNALLDSKAIECLRAWSGNEKLLQSLPVDVVSEGGRKTCHGKLDGMLADVARNPDKFKFSEVTAPKVVTRAIDLQEARRMAALANPAAHVPPAALTRPAPAPAAFAMPDPTVDLGIAGTKLAEAETLCQKTQQAAAGPKANPRLKSFAAFCVGNLRQLRSTMQLSARNGHSSESLDAMATSATNVANIARNLLAAGNE